MFRLTCLSLDCGHTGGDRASLSSELFVNNGRQPRTNPTDLVQLVYGSSSNLNDGQRIAACSPPTP